MPNLRPADIRISELPVRPEPKKPEVAIPAGFEVAFDRMPFEEMKRRYSSEPAFKAAVDQIQDRRNASHARS